MALTTNNQVTRFLTRVRTTDSNTPVTQDGPVSGAIQVIQVTLDDVANNETASSRVTFPPGCSFYISDIYAGADSVTSDPSLTIGTSAAGTQIAKAVNLTTNLGAVTLKQNDVSAGSFIDIVLVADAGDAAESVYLTITGYITAPPTTLAYRGS